MAKTTEQIGTEIFNQGGGDIGATADVISGVLDEILTEFEGLCDAAHAAINKDSTVAAEKAFAAEKRYVRLGIIRTLAETMAIMHAKSSVSRLDEAGRARVAGAFYRRVVSEDQHKRAREALRKLGEVDQEPSNTFEATVFADGWSRDL